MLGKVTSQLNLQSPLYCNKDKALGEYDVMIRKSRPSPSLAVPGNLSLTSTRKWLRLPEQLKVTDTLIFTSYLSSSS